MIDAERKALLIAIIRANFTEFPIETHTDEVLNYHIDVASEIYSNQNAGIIYLTLHLVSLATASGSEVSGELIKMTFGAKSIETKAIADKEGDSYFTSTKYGALYIKLRNSDIRVANSFLVL